MRKAMRKNQKSLGKKTCLFLELPQEIILTIFSCYCDARSLSTFSIVSISSASHRHLFQRVSETLCTRAGELCNLDLHPRCNVMVESLSGENQYKMKIISEKLPILSFLEDRNMHVRTADGVELPLWCGSLPFKRRDFSNQKAKDILQHANILVTTPSSSWNPSLLYEWRKIRKSSLSLLPMSRQTTPLPPLARLQGITAKDETILREVARSLNDRDEVISLGGEPFGRLFYKSYIPMKVIIMSRNQAVWRMKSGLGPLHCRLNNIWPLDYFTSKTGQITKMQDENSMPEGDGLFAFMDGPFEDSDCFGNRISSDITSVAQDMIVLMNMHRKLKRKILKSG